MNVAESLSFLFSDEGEAAMAAAAAESNKLERERVNALWDDFYAGKFSYETLQRNLGMHLIGEPKPCFDTLM